MYDIPTCNVPLLAEKIEALNRRCRKLGQPEIAFKVGDTFEVEKAREATGVKYKISYTHVEIEGNSPKISGWRLAAAIETLESGENVVRCVPGETVPEAFRTTDMRCDHCKSERRRKEIFVLAHDDGRYCQVGRNCIADFLGHISVETMIGRAEWIIRLESEVRDLEESDYYGGRGGEILVTTDEFLQTVAICIRRLGWLSRSKAAELYGEFGGPQPTANIAWQVITAHDKYTKELIAEAKLYVEDRDVELATKALEWAKALPTTGESEYIYNLGVACRNPVVKWKTTGIVASAVAAYSKHVERVQELERKRVVSQHVGELGKRQGFAQVTVRKLQYFESQFGTKTLAKFEDGDGNTLIWWASSNTDWLEEGNVLDITATVKKHSDYKGWKQTELSRVAEGLPKPKKAKKAKKAEAA